MQALVGKKAGDTLQVSVTPEEGYGPISEDALIDIPLEQLPEDGRQPGAVITAVGLSDHLFIMMAAVVIAVGVMMFAARPIGDFVDRHPSVKMLALSFLILVGFTLMLESFDVHVPKGYIYFAMFFSIAVESLNLLRNKKNPL